MKKSNEMMNGVKEIFVGMDVHKKFWVVSIYTEGVFLRESVHILPKVENVVRFLKRWEEKVEKKQIHLVYEAGCFGYWIAHRLNRLGYDCQVTPPTLIPTERGNKVKTDKKDSRKLAQLLSKGMLKKNIIPEESVLHFRELLRTRNQLVQMRGDIERRIKAKLLMHGIFPDYEHSGKWSELFIQKLRSVIRGTGIEPSVEALLNAREGIHQQITPLEKTIQEKLIDQTSYQYPEAA